MHLLAQQARLVRAGFVHLPWLPEQGRPHLALNEAVRAIERVILTTLETDRDLRLSGGSIS
jgi:pyroglutamyl-peptidase